MKNLSRVPRSTPVLLASALAVVLSVPALAQDRAGSPTTSQTPTSSSTPMSSSPPTSGSTPTSSSTPTSGSTSGGTSASPTTGAMPARSSSMPASRGAQTAGDSASTQANSPAQSRAVGLLSVVNKAEIEAGQVALKQAQNDATKRYAQRMITEHTENDSRAAMWKPDPSGPAAKAKAADAKTKLATLKQQNGAAFDKAYLQAMVMDHQQALKALDEKIMPAAKDPALVTFLTETRAHVASHLEEAQTLMSSAGGAGSSR